MEKYLDISVAPMFGRLLLDGTPTSLRNADMHHTVCAFDRAAGQGLRSGRRTIAFKAISSPPLDARVFYSLVEGTAFRIGNIT